MTTLLRILPLLRSSVLLSAFFYFLTPLVAQPHLEWSRTYALNRTKTNQPLSLVVAPDNSIIVSGTSGNLSGDLDYLTIKYAPNGDEQWLQRFDSAGANDVLRRQAIDTQGNVTITGTSKTVSYALREINSGRRPTPDAIWRLTRILFMSPGFRRLTMRPPSSAAAMERTSGRGYGIVSTIERTLRKF